MMVKKIGFSSLIDGAELPKSDFHFEVLGDLDECSAAIAVARSHNEDAEVQAALKTVQEDLSLLMAMVAGIDVDESLMHERLTWIEGLISELKRIVEMPKAFIVPGETKTEAYLDYARAVTRRSERSLMCLEESTTKTDKTALQYLNRISSLLYLYEIKARSTAG